MEPLPKGATASERFGAFVAHLSMGDVPTSVSRAAVLHVLDTIGVGIAAAALPAEALSARAALRVHTELGGAAEASVYGVAGGVPAPGAAFVNASLQHALDFDDIHTHSRVHPSTITVPAALAVAERTGATGGQTIAAVVAGNEVALRIGMGGPRHFQVQGFHGTPVCGVFGAAAAAASLMRLDATTAAHALGIAGDVAGGTNAWMSEGTTNKHLHAGWAAQNGILAALLAAEGAQGPRAAFEGRFGVYEALGGSPGVKSDDIVGDLGAGWKTPEIAFKAYPSCYWMHASVDAATELRGEILEALEDVELLEAIVPTAAVPLVLEPRETRIRPLTAYAGKFSLQDSVAATILRGPIDLATYTAARLDDAAVLELAARVTWRISEDLDRSKHLYSGGIQVRFRDGRERTVIVQNPRGTTLHPLTQEEVLNKFRINASFGLGHADVASLESALLGLPSLATLDEISLRLRAVRPR